MKKKIFLNKAVEFDYIKQRLDEKEHRLKETEEENIKHTKEIDQIKKDNLEIKNEMETMRQYILKIASSKVNPSPQNDFVNHSQEPFTPLITYQQDERASSLDPHQTSRTSEFTNEMNRISVDRQHETMMDSYPSSLTRTSPPPKILKKKKGAKRRFKKKRRRNSPLTKTQLKLLNNPKSYEKYAKILKMQIQKLNPSKKKKGNNTARAQSKLSTKEAEAM
jgi:hypothetical protein